MKKIIIITGQTATGKTKLAQDFAKKYNGELINCDSRQIYKKLDIITGKDRPVGIKIWLYDIVDPKQYFSSYDYVQQALPLIKKLLKNNKTPVIVGETYLYIKHLLYGVETENIPPDWYLRKKLEKKTISELHKILSDLDVQSFKRLNNSDKNNPRRLIRKIEIITYLQKEAKTSVFEQSPGAPINGVRRRKNTVSSFVLIGLKHKNKEDLIKAIKTRVQKRLKKGAIEEVKKLLSLGYTENDPGLKTIGYQQIIQYLKSKITKEEAIKQWITKEIQYAKRQYTFMKKDKNIRWQALENLKL